MYAIIGGRSTGKTRKLMEFAKENNAMVICSNPLAMASKARNYGIIGLSFVSYADYFKQENKEGNAVIDELDNYYQFIDKNIIGYTLTMED